MSPVVFDPDALRVCGGCGGLYGPLTLAPDEWRVQECDCRPARPRVAGPSGSSQWGQDFNTAAELCRCCANEVLPSGHRFATWFCAPCRAEVHAHNERIGRVAIPIGRHSLMAGIGLSGQAVDVPGEVERFARATAALFDAVGRLERCVGPVVRDRLTALGFAEDAEPTLAEYLAVGRASPVDPRAALARLLGYLAADGDGEPPDR